MLASADVERLGSADPIAAKAELLGANIVTSLRESTVSRRSALVSAPATPLRPAAIAVSETGCGMVNRLSITWTTPPVKFWSWNTNVTF